MHVDTGTCVIMIELLRSSVLSSGTWQRRRHYVVARQPCRVLDQYTPLPLASTVTMSLSLEESEYYHTGLDNEE